MNQRGKLFALSVLFLFAAGEAAIGAPAPKSAKVRPAKVAGSFYPAGAAELSAGIERALSQAKSGELAGQVRALIVPHAGYQYSAIVAAAGFKSVSRPIHTVFIIASNHTAHAPHFSLALPGEDFFSTPLGQVKVAPAAAKLRENSLFSVVEAAFDSHVIEVQLPFLQKVLGSFEIVPIVTGDVADEELRLAATLIAPHLSEESLVVVSSDLSHYHPYAAAQTLDRKCIAGIAAQSAADVAKCEACGVAAVKMLLNLASARGWQAKIIDYRNSGDTAGDKSAVVGYAAIAFYSSPRPAADSELSSNERRALLKTARMVLESYTKEGKVPAVAPQDFPWAARVERGCFVTLHKDGDLRGCIGTIMPQSSLLRCVVENTVQAAAHDPRFAAVTPEELAHIEIEISMLTLPRIFAHKSAEGLLAYLQPGRHGVILRQGLRQATFLPQVWEQLPSKEQFLGHLCRKGGMAEECWKSSETEVQLYEDSAFRERDMTYTR